MFKQLRVGAQVFQKYIGWNRVGMLLSLAIIVVAVVVLVHMLRDIKLDEVARAVEATQLRHIAAAAVFVALGYFTLTFYDWFALRAINRAEIPYRIAALSAFTSYSIGHNIGATVFTGGAVRYRIYSTYGLDAIEVAKICFIAGLTFWLGNVTVLGLGIVTTPHAAGLIDQLPDWANRVYWCSSATSAGCGARRARWAKAAGRSICRAEARPCCRSGSASSTSASVR